MSAGNQEQPPLFIPGGDCVSPDRLLSASREVEEVNKQQGRLKVCVCVLLDPL